MTNNPSQENKENNTDAKNASAKDIAPNRAKKSREEALKTRFKAGSIPLQSDFADLIDMANAGWQATGQDSDPKGPGKGMRLSDSKQLEPDIDAFDFTHSPAGCSPVQVDIGTNKIVVDLNNGLIHEKEGLTVKSGRGITVNANGVNIKASLGITVDDNGVSVKAGDGIDVDATKGVSIKPGKGMSISRSGQIEPNNIPSFNFKNYAHGCSPVKVNSDTNSLVIDLHDGLVDTDSGLAVKVGSGIMLSNGAVSIDQEKVLPPGIITMFSGSQVPSGWALCDGKNNTPDLRDRFIVMTGIKFKQGKGEGTTSTGSATVEGSVYVAGTRLTSSQIPSHQHTVELNSFYYSDTSSNRQKLCVLREGSDPDGAHHNTYTKSTGDGESHTHNATLTNSPHSHTISAIPPYYALAFIMKL